MTNAAQQHYSKISRRLCPALVTPDGANRRQTRTVQGVVDAGEVMHRKEQGPHAVSQSSERIEVDSAVQNDWHGV